MTLTGSRSSTIAAWRRKNNLSTLTTRSAKWAQVRLVTTRRFTSEWWWRRCNLPRKRSSMRSRRRQRQKQKAWQASQMAGKSRLGKLNRKSFSRINTFHLSVLKKANERWKECWSSLGWMLTHCTRCNLRRNLEFNRARTIWASFRAPQASLAPKSSCTIKATGIWLLWTHSAPILTKTIRNLKAWTP